MMAGVTGSGSISTIHDAMKQEPGAEFNVVTVYKDWSSNYDKDISSAEHCGSIMAAEELEALCMKEERKGIYVIDIGAGTGRASIELRRRGFSKIDGLDPSEHMLNVAKDKQLYNKYICAFITENQLDIDNATYDAIVCVGTISVGHLPHGSIKEMYRIIKPGGHIIIVGSGREWKRLSEYSVKMTGLINDLEKEGKLRVLKTTYKEGYMFRGTPDSIDAIIYVIKKL